LKSLVLTAALETTTVIEPKVRTNPPIVRRVAAMRTPLDLAIIPFRYRVRGNTIEAVRPNCRHRR
jgi:hypothetical protein